MDTTSKISFLFEEMEMVGVVYAKSMQKVSHIIPYPDNGEYNDIISCEVRNCLLAVAITKPQLDDGMWSDSALMRSKQYVVL